MPAGRSTRKEGDSLPPGWEEHKDEYGRSYYYHSNTDESTWTRPIQVAVDTGDQSYYVVIKSESERQQFFAGVYRELRAAMPFLPKARKHPSKKGKMVPVKVPTMVELYKAARHENVAPQEFASFISKSLNEKVGKSKGNAPSSSSSSPAVLRSSNSPLRSPRRTGKGVAGGAKSLRRSRRGGAESSDESSASKTVTKSKSKTRTTARKGATESNVTPGFSPNPLAFSSPRKSNKRTFNQRAGASDGRESVARAAKRVALAPGASGMKATPVQRLSAGEERTEMQKSVQPQKSSGIEATSTWMKSAMRKLFDKAEYRGAFTQLVEIVHAQERLLYSKPLKSFNALFHAIDKDAGGTISSDELCKALRRLDVGLRDSEIDSFVALFDFNNDEEISEDEFVSVMSVGEALLEEAEAEAGEEDYDEVTEKGGGARPGDEGGQGDGSDGTNINHTLTMLAMQREKLKLQVEDSTNNGLLDSILGKEKIIGDLEARIAELLERISRLEQELFDSRSKFERSASAVEAARSETEELRGALKIAEEEKGVAEHTREELMKQMEQIFGQQQSQLASSGSEISAAWMARDIAQNEAVSANRALDAARTLAKDLREQVRILKADKQRVKETAHKMVRNNKDLQAAAVDAKKRATSLQESCSRLADDLAMAREQNKDLARSLESAKQGHSAEVRRLRAQIQDLGGGDDAEEGEGGAGGVVFGLRLALAEKERECVAAMSHIQALSAQLDEGKSAQKKLASLRLREAELKGQLRTLTLERSHEHTQRDATRELLERQLQDQKQKYERQIANLRRATKHRDRLLREKSEGILQRASEIEVDREQAVELLRSAKLELVESQAEVEQLRQELHEAEVRAVKRQTKHDERHAEFIAELGVANSMYSVGAVNRATKAAAKNAIVGDGLETPAKAGESNPVHFDSEVDRTRHEMRQHFKRLKALWEKEHSEELELALQRAQAEKVKEIEALRKSAERDLRRMQTEMNVAIEKERLDGDRRVKEAQSEVEGLKEKAELELELAVERAKAEFEFMHERRTGETMRFKDQRIAELEVEHERAADAVRKEAAKEHAKKIQDVVAKRETDIMRLRRAEALRRLRDHFNRLDGLAVARAWRRWTLRDAQALVNDVADGSFLYARKLDALQRMQGKVHERRARGVYRAFYRWRAFCVLDAGREYRKVAVRAVNRAVAAERLRALTDRRRLSLLSKAMRAWSVAAGDSLIGAVGSRSFAGDSSSRETFAMAERVREMHKEMRRLQEEAEKAKATAHRLKRRLLKKAF